MKCEHCNETHDGTYGSGRFCNVKCARSYSTSRNREEISKKTSKTLAKTKAKPERFCSTCKASMGTNYRKRNRHCSRECAYKRKISIETREKLSKKASERELKGSYGIRCEVQYNEKIIKTDSLLEVICIRYLVNTLGGCDLKRSSLRLSYTDYLGVDRKYTPDFEIVIDGINCIVECKSVTHSNASNNKHWTRYRENAILKKTVIEQYCKDHGMQYIHYTDKTEPGLYQKFYRKYRKNPCKLYQALL